MVVLAISIVALLILWMPILSAGFVISRSLPVKRRVPLKMMVSSSSSSYSQNNLQSISSSLASDYAIRIQTPSPNNNVNDNEIKWELYPLSNWEESDLNLGTLALRALDDCATLQNMPSASSSVCKLCCSWEQSSASTSNTWSINVAAAVGNEKNIELQCILGRVMVQCAALQIANQVSCSDIDVSSKKTILYITLPLLEGEGCQKVLLSDLTTNSAGSVGVKQLFNSMNSDYANSEIVDMVTKEGIVLGSVPRPYVHNYNLLHRGIGMIVSKDVDIIHAMGKSGDDNETPEVYVHQRTATKRIFPSLYDMFVGGVSSSGEDSQLTAAREVAEELGLTRALDILEDKDHLLTTKAANPLSDMLFQCTICTSYNRCVVSMFTYTCDTSIESITWQEEEVQWGDFIDYDIIETAAALSIDRLVKKNAWPGRYESGSSSANDLSKEESHFFGEWANWDFVPDGLLVWEAWVAFISEKRNRSHEE